MQRPRGSDRQFFTTKEVAEIGRSSSKGKGKGGDLDAMSAKVMSNDSAGLDSQRG
jgi:hypothetical protein